MWRTEYEGEHPLHSCGGLRNPRSEAPGRNPQHWPLGQNAHRDYLREYHPIRFNELILTGQLWTYLAGLNEQAQVRMETLIEQLKTAEGVTESLKANDPMAWVQRMNSIRARAEEIVREEIIYGEAAV